MSSSTDKTNKPKASAVADKMESDLIQTTYEEYECDTHDSKDKDAGSEAKQCLTRVDPSHPGYVAFLNSIFKKS